MYVNVDLIDIVLWYIQFGVAMSHLNDRIMGQMLILTWSLGTAT